MSSLFSEADLSLFPLVASGATPILYSLTFEMFSEVCLPSLQDTHREFNLVEEGKEAHPIVINASLFVVIK